MTTVATMFSSYFTSDLQVLVKSTSIGSKPKNLKGTKLHKPGLPINHSYFTVEAFTIQFSIHFKILYYTTILTFLCVLFLVKDPVQMNNGKYGIYRYNEVLSNLYFPFLKDRRIGVHLIRQLIRISTE